VAQSVKDEKVKGISNVQDHSDRHGMRIVLELKRDADPNVVLNQLFQFTPLQDTFSIIMLALVDSRPRTLSLKEMLKLFLDHRLTVLRRRTQFLLKKARNRAHILEGLLIALSSIDEVIERIRTSSDVPEARQKLMDLEVSAELLSRALGDEGFSAFQAIMGVQASYNLTRTQTDQILQMQLQRLTALEQDKILKEYGTIRDEITEYERLLSDDRNIMAVIREETLEIERKYSDARRTEIAEAAGEFNMEDLITEETNVVTISHEGYIKRMPLDAYRTQSRGGKGVTGGQTKEGDFLEDVFVASTHDYILFFTDLGQCYWLKVYDIPAQSRTSQGRAIVNLLQLRPEEKITSHVPVREFDNRCLFMITRRGVVKKTDLAAYSRPKQGGIIGISLDEGDVLISVLLTNEKDHVILSTKTGMSIRFDESRARAMGRNTHGVKGIELQEGDEVVGGVVVNAEDSLLTVCENGYGKRTPFSEYREQNRGGKGLIDIKTSERNGQVVSVASVHDDDEVMLISAGGMVVRIPVSGISVIGRNTQGVRLMNISEEDRVVSLAKIAREDLEGSEDAGLTAEAKSGMAPAAEEGAGAPPTTEEELAEESETPPEE
jgi:DNA gyrase subunit A